ncbi:unnamed protein product [Caenorhabditis brenneri]
MDDTTINGDPRYLNYKFDFFKIPVLTACLPAIWLSPTIVIVIKIIKVYIHHLVKKREESINHHVFTVIVLHLILSFCYLLADFISIRMPATGLITSWCASLQPNHGLKLLFMMSAYFNYTAMLFPFMLSILRLIPVYYPFKLEELCARIVRFGVPIIFLYPFCFCFALFPALGDCRQLLGTYQFGGIYFYYTGAWFGIHQSRGLLSNSIFWLCACTIANFLLYRKFRKMRRERESAQIRKAELCLTLITISMFPSYFTNIGFLIAYLIDRSYSAYAIALRPYGSDCEFCFVAWIFYLTHPIFFKKQTGGVPKEETRATTL